MTDREHKLSFHAFHRRYTFIDTFRQLNKPSPALHYESVHVSCINPDPAYEHGPDHVNLITGVPNTTVN